MSTPESSQSFDRAAQSSRIYAYFHRYKNLLRRHWWIPALTITLAVSAQAWRTWHTPPSYIYTGKLVVNMKIQSAVQGGYNEEMVNFNGTQAGLMQSGRVLSRAADRVHRLHPEARPPAIPVSINVAVPPRTGIFQIVATGFENDYTRLYLDACMDEYINLKKEMLGNVTDETIAGLNTTLTQLQKDLNLGEEELLQFQSSNNIADIESENKSSAARLSGWRQQLTDLRIQYELYKKLDLDVALQMEQKNSPSQADVANSTDTATNLAAQGASYLHLKQTLHLKKAEREELAERLLPKHPRMVALDNEIASEEKLLQILRQQNAEQITNTCAEIKIKIENLEPQIAELNADALKLNQKLVQYEKLKSVQDRNQLRFNFLQNSLQNIETGQRSDSQSVVILEHASGPIPNAPKLLRVLSIAAFIGLTLGSALLFLIDRIDDRPTSFTEMQEMFDEPILGQVPGEKPLAKGGEVKLLQTDDDRHAFVEAYRNLRSSLLYMATEGKRARTILVTSAVPEDGKSMTTANLALTLAQSGSTVLLIDADLRRGQLHKRLGVDMAGGGFTEVLTTNLDWKNAVCKTRVPTLSFIPRGSLCKNPGELFLKTATHEILSAMSGQFDYVIIDSPPVMAADDVASLAPHVEGVVFVVRAGKTSARVAHAALDVLYQREVKILGLVFNGVEAAATEYYFYKYKDYSHYGA